MNMRNLTRTATMLMILGLLGAGCSSQREIMTGNDRDEHGCIASAGYTWSEVRQDCIRTFEVGIRLDNATNPQATTSAFAVFAKDSSLVELYLPTSKQHPILEKVSNSEWKHKSYKLEQTTDGLKLYKKSKLIYQSIK